MLNEIVNSSKYVMDNSLYVKINYEVLDNFISMIDCSKLKNWLLYNPYNILELDVDDIVNFLLFFNSIDYSFFGNPKWTVETLNGSKDGSDALMYLLLNYVKENKIVDFRGLTFDDFSNLLKGNVDIPLLKERYRTIMQVNKIVESKMSGNFYQYIKNVTSDVELFDIIVSNFPSFRDEREYKGRTIYFYKLAQLLTSDILNIRKYLENIEVDYSNLVGCADYKIPQVLRAIGITEYSSDLASIVDEKIEIGISSKYEVEIRASQIVVLSYIKSKLKNVCSMDINDFLFMYSKEVKDIVKPYHLCRNKNY